MSQDSKDCAAVNAADCVRLAESWAEMAKKEEKKDRELAKHTRRIADAFRARGEYIRSRIDG